MKSLANTDHPQNPINPTQPNLQLSGRKGLQILIFFIFEYRFVHYKFSPDEGIEFIIEGGVKDARLRIRVWATPHAHFFVKLVLSVSANDLLGHGSANELFPIVSDAFSLELITYRVDYPVSQQGQM